jgi:uncharacterized membrane protein
MGLIKLWVTVSAVYFLVAVLAPLFEYYRIDLFNFFYLFLRTICHQILDRTFWIWGSNMGLCSKCLGFYLMQPLVFISIKALKIKRYNSPLVSLFSLVLFFLMVADSTFLKFSNANISRFILGILAGIGFGLILFQIYFKWGGSMERFWRKWKVVAVVGTCLIHFASMYNVAFAQDKKRSNCVGEHR